MDITPNRDGVKSMVTLFLDNFTTMMTDHIHTMKDTNVACHVKDKIAGTCYNCCRNETKQRLAVARSKVDHNIRNYK